MKIRLIAALFAVVPLLQMFAAAQTVSADRVAFTVPDAPWMIKFDNNNLEIKDMQVKRDNRSGYFLLSDEKSGLTVSLFIEPAVKCKTSAECRDFVFKTGNPSWGKIQDVVQSKIGEISYFEFYRPTVQNQPLKMFDMYAQFVEDGYWVDLHVSKVLYKKADHASIENFVKSVAFVSKIAAPVAEPDKTTAAAQKAMENWMLLWDAGKYAESYEAVSSFSKKIFNEKTWLTYAATERKPLGALKSRKILNISLIKSLYGAPGNSGAVFKYQSSFENRADVFETFSLVFEKEGVWRVLVYNTNE